MDLLTYANRDDAVLRKLATVVRNAMYPFKTGTVRAFIEPVGFDWSGHKFYLEVETLPRHVFKHMISETALLSAYNPEDYLVIDMRDSLFNHFRHRWVEPEDHIILGEE
jgi:hypothetical protein